MLPKNFKISALLAALAGLAACVSNPYKINYSGSIPDHVPKAEPAQFVAEASVPKLLSSTDIRTDAIKLLENGYFPIGSAKFTGPTVDEQAALRQAAEVGAAAVIVKQQHVGTKTESVAIYDWAPDHHITVNETARTQGSDPKDVQVYDRQTTTTIEGESEVHYVPEQVDYYDHTAVFWKKTAPPVLGLLVSELEDPERKLINSNKGVLVKVVVKGSPAFLADFFRGDIIRRFDGAEVIGSDDFFSKVLKSAGKTVDIELWREGAKLTKHVALNPVNG